MSLGRYFWGPEHTRLLELIDGPLHAQMHPAQNDHNFSKRAMAYRLRSTNTMSTSKVVPNQQSACCCHHKQGCRTCKKKSMRIERIDTQTLQARAQALCCTEINLATVFVVGMQHLVSASTKRLVTGNFCLVLLSTCHLFNVFRIHPLVQIHARSILSAVLSTSVPAIILYSRSCASVYGPIRHL